MRILHTSDWHIGRNVHNRILDTEFNEFVNWLINTIEEQNIDILIVAGDIFDIAFPSAAAQKLYYSALAKLVKTRLKHIIIIGGNHDSANFLKSPDALLSSLNITVIAGAKQSLDQYILPLPAHNPQVIVAALPYLKALDVLQFFPTAELPQQQVLSIAQIYWQVYEKAKNKYNDLPLIATGHLYVTDGDFDDIDNRDYTLGGLLDVPSSQLPPFDYYALGHVHRPQVIANRIYYSGNPFQMSFNDVRRPHKKQVLIYDTETGTAEPVYTPVFRQFVKFTGSMEQVIERLEKFENSGKFPPAYAMVELTDHPDYPIEAVIDDLMSVNDQQNVQIINIKIPPKHNSPKFIGSNLRSINEMSETEIFKAFLESAGYQEAEKQLLLSTFEDLLDLYRQAQQG